MLGAMKAEPASVAFAGGSAAGGFDHLEMLQLAETYCVEDPRSIRHIGVDGGADAVPRTVDGLMQAMTGDMSEIVVSIQSGKVRALAVLSEERVEGFDIPTAIEQGVDMVGVNRRGLYGPGGILDETFDEWETRLQGVAHGAK